jgi:hypothetical protein
MAMRRKARTARPRAGFPLVMLAPPCLRLPPWRGHSGIGPMAADLMVPGPAQVSQ